MKSLLLLLLLSLSLSLLSQAQSWCPPGAVWTYNYSGMFQGGGSITTYQKDTVIASQTCQKLTRFSHQEPSSISFTSDPHYTFERNDTVFFYYAQAFRPVYYWNAQFGDSITYYNTEPFQPCDTVMHLVVDSAGTTVINGETLRFYRTHNLAADTSQWIYPPKITVIEKLGAINHYLLPFYSCYVDGDFYSLRCYTDDSFALYQTDSSIACNLYMAVNTVEKELGITLHPNPTNAQLYVTTADTKITIYQVLDYSGKEILIKDANTDVLQLNLSTLPEGIYLLKLELANGQYAVRRFIKI